MTITPTTAIPSRDECLALMEAHAMLPHIREHSLVVAEAAVWVGRALVEAGCALDLALIEAGALLHDLGKTPCLGTGHNHAEWGYAALATLGLPEVAQIVREHVILAAGRKSGPVHETEVVHYADKRVLHVRVVSVAERFQDLHVRYGRTPEAVARLDHLRVKTLALEGKLFQPLTVQPHDLLKLNGGRREP
ncbi:MAG: HD domain-containing protein [Deltaproteobacteria bacterium]|nr:HD domain-containing protein [Deltaproteobacteria bacterium]